MDLYNVNFTLRKDIEKDGRKSKALPCSQTLRLSIMEIIIQPKSICIFIVISVKNPMIFFIKIEK